MQYSLRPYSIGIERLLENLEGVPDFDMKGIEFGNVLAARFGAVQPMAKLFQEERIAFYYERLDVRFGARLCENVGLSKRV
ncbi:hypothetical protein PACILC2_36790 [Paenibacillus cisolokensis]|uniref:Uncharacterized protein n=1 Tax=Paenibacillus cisolokensis TaxID=1658519 RepID=A0ABQ4NAA6_9BACL|nr:hypothetical protein PACILC2_36790 [Paenibacillus cisolokensis]